MASEDASRPPKKRVMGKTPNEEALRSPVKQKRPRGSPVKKKWPVNAAKLKKLAKQREKNQSPKHRPTTCSTPEPVLKKNHDGEEKKGAGANPKVTFKDKDDVVFCTPPRRKKRSAGSPAGSPAMSLDKAEAILSGMKCSKKKPAVPESSSEPEAIVLLLWLLTRLLQSSLL